MDNIMWTTYAFFRETDTYIPFCSNTDFKLFPVSAITHVNISNYTSQYYCPFSSPK